MTGRSSLPEGLLNDIKIYLNITWNDEATDKKISGLIASGIYYLDLKRGASADYTAEGLPRTLLFDFVRYARDDALDVFENNYLSLIVAMRNESLVNDYAEKSKQTS